MPLSKIVQDSIDSTSTGVCRAWVNFDGSTGAIAASFNVSTVTKKGTGWYTINFATAMPDTSYATIPMCQPTVSNSGSDTFAIANLTTSVDVRHYEVGVARDGAYCSVAIFR